MAILAHKSVRRYCCRLRRDRSAARRALHRQIRNGASTIRASNQTHRSLPTALTTSHDDCRAMGPWPRWRRFAPGLGPAVIRQGSIAASLAGAAYRSPPVTDMASSSSGEGAAGVLLRSGQPQRHLHSGSQAGRSGRRTSMQHPRRSGSRREIGGVPTEAIQGNAEMDRGTPTRGSVAAEEVGEGGPETETSSSIIEARESSL